MLVAPYSDSALVASFRSSTPHICSYFTSGSCRFRAACWFSHSVPSSPDPICLVCNPVHITANIRKQLDRAEGLHQGVGCHRSDDDLCETLVSGGYHWTGVTPADIRLNRKFRGACLQCIQGKMKQRSTLDEPISSPPASVGAKIWGDVERFTTKSVGGNLAAFKFYDEFSGNSTVCALPNLTVD